MNDMLTEFYRSHHVAGRRLRQSFMEARRAELFSKWIGSGKKVLDLGCRDGILTSHFAESNHVVGADIDTEALEFAEKTYGIETAHLDLNGPFPFEAGTFDAVVMAEVLEHLPYPKLTLQEVKRVLVPNGLFLGNVPLAYHLKDRYRVMRGKKLIVGGDPTHLQYFTYSDLKGLLSRYFQVQELEVLKGQKWARLSPDLFARNVAFRCTNG